VLGEVCDGTTSSCPDSGQCGAEVVEGRKTVEVLCEAPSALGLVGVRCSSVGFDPVLTSTPSGVSGHGSTGPGSSCNPSKRALTVAVSVPQKTGPNPDVLQRRVKLQLTSFGRKLLRRKGSLELCVQVRIKSHRRVLFSTFQSVVVEALRR
jgi:hypothetical protein